MKDKSYKLDSDKMQGVLAIAKSLKIDVEEKLVPPQIAWQMSNVNSKGFSVLGTLGNFSLVIGKAKSRKSFFINIAVSTAVSNGLILERFKSDLPLNQNEVLYFDTEQGKFHVQLALQRICRQINIKEPTNLHVYSLRSKTPSERLKIIEALIYSNPKIGFVVIDGIKDLVTSINDEEQASMVTTKLLKWTEEKNIHIVTVLHQNKSDNNARGHLGTELINKAETVLSVTKAEGNNDISIVEPQQCRNREPENFAFEIIDELPAIVKDFEIRAATRKNSFDITGLEDAKKFGLLTEVFRNGSSFSYGILIDQIKLAYKKEFKKDIGTNKAKDLYTNCKNKGWLIQEKHKAPYTIGEFKKPLSV